MAGWFGAGVGAWRPALAAWVPRETWPPEVHGETGFPDLLVAQG